MMGRSLGILLIVFMTLVMSGISQAQEAETWYWAAESDSGRLLAFTLDGEVNTLLEQTNAVYLFQVWRTAPDSGLAIITVGDDTTVYRLTSQSAEPLRSRVFLLPDPGVFLAARSQKALLLVDPRQSLVARLMTVNALLVNETTNQVTLLERVADQAWAFSADGTYLRYVAAQTDDADNPQWALFEHDLTTGNLTILQNLSLQLSGVVAHPQGDFWLTVTPEADTRRRVFTLLAVPTMTERVIEPVLAAPDRNPVPDFRFLEDALIEYDFLCEENCRVLLRPLSGGEPLGFDAPALRTFLYPLRQIAPDSPDAALLVNVRDRYLLLRPDGEAQLLGVHDERLGLTPGTLLSSDGRYLLVSAEGVDFPRYRLWDLSTGEIVLESDDSGFRLVLPRYTGGGLLIAEDLSRWQYFREGELTVLPGIMAA
ncbi:MAG: hypothetical protein SF029_09830 [bacterium]|nr:hypothetical protein [bacterium]